MRQIQITTHSLVVPSPHPNDLAASQSILAPWINVNETCPEWAPPPAHIFISMTILPSRLGLTPKSIEAEFIVIQQFGINSFRPRRKKGCAGRGRMMSVFVLRKAALSISHLSVSLKIVLLD